MDAFIMGFFMGKSLPQRLAKLETELLDLMTKLNKSLEQEAITFLQKRQFYETCLNHNHDVSQSPYLVTSSLRSSRT